MLLTSILLLVACCSVRAFQPTPYANIPLTAIKHVFSIILCMQDCFPMSNKKWEPGYIFVYSWFSHDVTDAMLEFLNNETVHGHVGIPIQSSKNWTLLLERFSIECRKELAYCFGLWLLHSVIGSKFSRQSFSTNQKWNQNQSCTFSRALCRLRVITSSFDWFTGLSPSFLIGQSNYFGFGFYDTRLKLALCKLFSFVFVKKHRCWSRQ